MVIVNNDKQVKLKGGVPFMSEAERVEIIKDNKYVDVTFLAIDQDVSVSESLERVAQQYGGELVFAKGGDRHFDNLPESEKKVCQQYKIRVVSNVGGGKVQSSSWLIKNTAKDKAI